MVGAPVFAAQRVAVKLKVCPVIHSSVTMVTLTRNAPLKSALLIVAKQNSANSDSCPCVTTKIRITRYFLVHKRRRNRKNLMIPMQQQTQRFLLVCPTSWQPPALLTSSKSWPATRSAHSWKRLRRKSG